GGRRVAEDRSVGARATAPATPSAGTRAIRDEGAAAGRAPGAARVHPPADACARRGHCGARDAAARPAADGGVRARARRDGARGGMADAARRGTAADRRARGAPAIAWRRNRRWRAGDVDRRSAAREGGAVRSVAAAAAADRRPPVSGLVSPNAGTLSL